MRERESRASAHGSGYLRPRKGRAHLFFLVAHPTGHTQLVAHPPGRTPYWSHTQLVAHPTGRTPNSSHTQLVAHPTVPRTPFSSQACPQQVESKKDRRRHVSGWKNRRYTRCVCPLINHYSLLSKILCSLSPVSAGLGDYAEIALGGGGSKQTFCSVFFIIHFFWEFLNFS